MNRQEYLLVVDFGTSSVGATALRPGDGSILLQESTRYQWLHPESGQTEIDPNEIWEASQNSVKRLLEALSDRSRPVGMTFSFFGDNVIPVDGEGRALDNLLPAIDGRTKQQVKTVTEQISDRRFYEITGGLLDTMCIGTKILWLQKHRPDVYENAVAYHDIQQYIMQRLGLGPASDFTMASRTMVYDIQNTQWSERLMEAFQIPSGSIERTPRESTDTLGRIKEYGSVSLPVECPVVMGAHDVTCAMIGTGAIPSHPGLLGDVIGTFDIMGRITDQPMLDYESADPRCWFYCGPTRDTYMFMGTIPTAGALLEWYVSEIHPSNSEDVFGELFKSAEFNGRNSLVAIPYFDQSEGMLQGLELSTEREMIFEALVESIGFENRSILEACDPFFTEPVERIRAGGGGAKSPPWLQLKASVTRTPFEQVRNTEISTLGAGVIAAVALNRYRDLEDAVSNMVGVKDTFAPDSDVADRYDRLYSRFKRLKASSSTDESSDLD